MMAATRLALLVASPPSSPPGGGREGLHRVAAPHVPDGGVQRQRAAERHGGRRIRPGVPGIKLDLFGEHDLHMAVDCQAGLARLAHPQQFGTLQRFRHERDLQPGDAPAPLAARQAPLPRWRNYSQDPFFHRARTAPAPGQSDIFVAHVGGEVEHALTATCCGRSSPRVAKVRRQTTRCLDRRKPNASACPPFRSRSRVAGEGVLHLAADVGDEDVALSWAQEQSSPMENGSASRLRHRGSGACRAARGAGASPGCRSRSWRNRWRVRTAADGRGGPAGLAVDGHVQVVLAEEVELDAGTAWPNPSAPVPFSSTLSLYPAIQDMRGRHSM